MFGFVEGWLSPDHRDAFEQHLDNCIGCTELVVAAAGLIGFTPSEAATVPHVGPLFTPVTWSAAVPALGPGASLGRYVILQVIGRGGMGEVYAAYDPELDRKIAIKVIRETTTHDQDKPAARMRLLREAKAIARLSHPNVVSVYDAGTFDQRVFLAMEFVDGQTLAEWIKALPAGPGQAGEQGQATARKGGKRPRERWRLVVEVFSAAGRGLAAAHRARVVHRDFKPQNVMVGGDGAVRVMDFGLASEPFDPTDAAAAPSHQAGESAQTPVPGVARLEQQALSQGMIVGLTRTGALMGTPGYMAPEQFQGEPVDARSDQFSFCVALYEALYGERPFGRGTLPELVDNVLQGKVRPARANAAVPSWVRKILLRGLSVDRAHRFASMEELLAALSPSADPVRRRRRVVLFALSGALFVGAAATAGLVAEKTHRRAQDYCSGAGARMAGVWQVPPANQTAVSPQSRREKVHQAFLSTGRAFATDTWTRVSEILDGYATRWIDLYTDACQATHLRGEQSAQSLELRMTCLNEKLRDLNTLTDLFAGADGEVLVGATDAARALPDLRRCSDLKALRAVVAPPSDALTSAQVEVLRRELAELNVLEQAGRARSAVDRARTAVQTARGLGYPPILAESLYTLMQLHEKTDNYPEMEKVGKELFWLALAAHLDELALGAAQRIHEVVAISMVRVDEGEVWSALTESMLNRLGAGHDRQWSWLWNDRGAVLISRGRLPEARRQLEKALALKAKILGSDHPDVALTMTTIAALLLEMGDYAGALEQADGALARYTRAYGASHPATGRLLINSAEARVGLGRFQEALTLYRQSLEVWQAESVADSPMLGFPLTGIGVSSLALGDLPGAIDALQRALRLREIGRGDPILLAETRFALAGALWQKGERTRARLLAMQARAAYTRAPGGGRRLRAVDAWLATHTAEAAPVAAARH